MRTSVCWGKRPALAHFALALLFAGSLVRCDCEDVEFIAAATYTPDKVLDFGNVSVSSQKTMHVKVRSSGSAGLKIATSLGGDDTKWTVVVEQELLDGLTPGQTSTITVTYRPCPAAWDGNTLKETFDFNTCPSAPDSADLTVSESDLVGQPTRAGSHQILLSAQPVQPPVAEVVCPSGMMACGEQSPPLIACNGLTFGNVNAGSMPCDLLVEVRNKWRGDKPVGDLMIERMEIRVQDINERVITDGAEVGFTIVDTTGAALVVDPDRPFTVPIASGQMQGTGRFMVRFAGLRTGIWRGQAVEETGLRLYTNDPDHKIITVPLSGIGSAPDIQYFPSTVNYGPVEQGTTKTATVVVKNVGDADLQIADIRVASGSSEFVVSTSRGTAQNITMLPNAQVDVFLAYTPADTGTDDDVLVIGSNDTTEMCDGVPGRSCIPVTGGAVPRIRIDPNDTLVFVLPNPTPPPPIPPRNETLSISNVGFGDLIVSRLSITGPGGNVMHGSVDDFTIQGCTSNPCDLGSSVVLCPPTNAACNTSQRDFVITYQNNDISTTDLAELHVFSNDPTDPEHIVVLSAADVPCLFPTPVITLVTPRPCAGQPVTVNGMTSSGPMPNTVTDYQWQWLFAPGTPAFTAQGSVQTDFTPTEGGTYILGLNVTNSCGSVSQSPATETILVADSCN